MHGDKLNSDVGVVLDIDGVVIRNQDIIPGAKEAVQKLFTKDSSGNFTPAVPLVFATNGGGCMEEKKASFLQSILDVPVRPDQVVVSHTPMRGMVSSLADKRVVSVGGNKDILNAYGYQNVMAMKEITTAFPSIYPVLCLPDPQQHPSFDLKEDPVKAVMFMEDPGDWGQAIQVTMDLIETGGTLDYSQPRVASENQSVTVVFANPDFVYGGKWPTPRLTMGAFRMCLQRCYKEATGKELDCVQLGKPHQVTYDYVLTSLQSQTNKELRRVFCVGDNPKSDIEGCNAQQKRKLDGELDTEWSSILVRTGVWKGAIDENDLEHPASFVCEDISHAVATIQEHTHV